MGGINKLQKYPKCPLCNCEQEEFPPDLVGPCKDCIVLNPTEVKEWREKHRKTAQKRIVEETNAPEN